MITQFNELVFLDYLFVKYFACEKFFARSFASVRGFGDARGVFKSLTKTNIHSEQLLRGSPFLQTRCRCRNGGSPFQMCKMGKRCGIKHPAGARRGPQGPAGLHEASYCRAPQSFAGPRRAPQGFADLRTASLSLAGLAL